MMNIIYVLLVCNTRGDLLKHSILTHPPPPTLQEEFYRLESRLQTAYIMLLAAMGVQDQVHRYASAAEYASRNQVAYHRSASLRTHQYMAALTCVQRRCSIAVIQDNVTGNSHVNISGGADLNMCDHT
jgi:hypothetical protein